MSSKYQSINPEEHYITDQLVELELSIDTLYILIDKKSSEKYGSYFNQKNFTISVEKLVSFLENEKDYTQYICSQESGTLDKYNELLKQVNSNLSINISKSIIYSDTMKQEILNPKGAIIFLASEEYFSRRGLIDNSKYDMFKIIDKNNEIANRPLCLYFKLKKDVEIHDHILIQEQIDMSVKNVFKDLIIEKEQPYKTIEELLSSIKIKGYWVRQNDDYNIKKIKFIRVH